MSTFDECGHVFADLLANFGLPLELNTPTTEADFTLTVNGTVFRQLEVSTLLTQWVASTATLVGEFEVVATSAPLRTTSDQPRQVLLISEGSFALR